MKKRIVSMAFTLALLIGLFAVLGIGASAEDGAHTHCICGAEHKSIGDHADAELVTFTEWNGTDAISYTDGVAYVALSADVVLEGTVALTIEGDKTLYLCLNGHSITVNGDANAIEMNPGATLHLCDCSEGEVGSVNTTGESKRTVMSKDGDFYFYSGNLTATGSYSYAAYNYYSVANMTVYGGRITGAHGIYLGASNGKLTVYSGTITSTKNSALDVENGTLEINGGKIEGYSRGVYVSGDQYSYVVINGGEITTTESTMNAIDIQAGTVVVNAGKISSSKAIAIYNNNKGTLTINGGEIYGNTIGVVNNTETTLTITGGTISSNATSGTAVSNQKTGNVLITGGTIGGAKIGIHNSGTTGTVTLENGTIEATEIGIKNGNSKTTTKGTTIVTGGTINSSKYGIVETSASGGVTFKNGTIIAVEIGIRNEYTSVVTVNGGYIETTGTTNPYGSGAIFNTSSSASLIITDGTFKSPGNVIGVYRGSATISGGVFQGNGKMENFALRLGDPNNSSSSSTVTVTGGNFHGVAGGIKVHKNCTLDISGNDTVVTGGTYGIYIYGTASVTGITIEGLKEHSTTGIEVNEGGILVADGCTIKAYARYGIAITNSGNATIKGGVLRAVNIGIKNSSIGVMVLNGCDITVQSISDDPDLNPGEFVGISNFGDLTISGDLKISATTADIKINNAPIKITGELNCDAPLSVTLWNAKSGTFATNAVAYANKFVSANNDSKVAVSGDDLVLAETCKVTFNFVDLSGNVIGTEQVPAEAGESVTIPELDGYFVRSAVAFKEGDESTSIAIENGALTMPEYNVVATVTVGIAYPIWISGVQINESNAGDIVSAVPGASGTAIYDPVTNTLTLDNFTYNGEAGTVTMFSVVIFSEEDITVSLVGENKLVNTSSGDAFDFGIMCGKSLTIIGEDDASLSVEASDSVLRAQNISVVGVDLEVKGNGEFAPVVVYDSLKIEDSTLKATYDGTTANVSCLYANDILIKKSEVVVDGVVSGISASQNITILDSYVTTSAQRDAISCDELVIEDSEVNASLAACPSYLVANAIDVNGALVSKDSTLNVTTNGVTTESYKAYGIVADSVTLDATALTANTDSGAVIATNGVNVINTNVYDSEGNEIVPDPSIYTAPSVQTKAMYTVTYKYNGVIADESFAVELGAVLELPVVNVPGYVFGGFYTDPSYEFELNAAEPISGNVEVYVKLIKTIVNIEKISDDGLYTVTYSDGTTSTFVITDGVNGKDGREIEFTVTDTHIQWRYAGEATWSDLIALEALKGADGVTPIFKIEDNELKYSIDGGSSWVSLGKVKGEQGAPGENGVGIEKVEKTKTEDNVDTYTITLTNGVTYTFTVTNGTNGKDGVDGKDGANGADGKDGVDGNDGANGADGKDGVGIASIEKTKTEGNVDTYTITLTNGVTYTFTVTNGTNGMDGVDGKDGANGADGKDGVNGKDGVDGKDGANGLAATATVIAGTSLVSNVALLAYVIFRRKRRLF